MTICNFSNYSMENGIKQVSFLGTERKNTKSKRDITNDAYKSRLNSEYDNDKFTRSINIKNNTSKRSIGYKREIERKRKKIKNRVSSGLIALTISIGGIAFCSPKIENKKDIEVPAPIIEEIEETNVDKTPSQILNTEDKQEDLPTEEEINNDITPSVTPEINPEIQTSYNNLIKGIETFSKQLGCNGIELIKERIDKIAQGDIKVIDILKILWIESNGRVYDENGNILTSYTGAAFGPFQLTPDTVDYLNKYYGLYGTNEELNVFDPYDNLDACIYNLMFLKEKKEKDYEKDGSFPSGINNLMEAVLWCYHDGAWASSVSTYGYDYINKYRDLSKIDNYPDVVEYITDNDILLG